MNEPTKDTNYTSPLSSGHSINLYKSVTQHQLTPDAGGRSGPIYGTSFLASDPLLSEEDCVAGQEEEASQSAATVPGPK